MKAREESGVRNLLNTCLGESRAELMENANLFLGLINRYSYIILSIENVSSKRVGTYCTVHPFHRRPYCVMINDYVVFFYLKPSHFNGVGQVFFSYEKYLSKEFINPSYKNETLWILSQKENAVARRRMLFFMRENRDKNMAKLIEEVMLNINPAESKNTIYLVKNELINEIRSGQNVYTAEKYTIERFAKVFCEVLQKYNGEAYKKLCK